MWFKSPTRPSPHTHSLLSFEAQQTPRRTQPHNRNAAASVLSGWALHQLPSRSFPQNPPCLHHFDISQLGWRCLRNIILEPVDSCYPKIPTAGYTSEYHPRKVPYSSAAVGSSPAKGTKRNEARTALPQLTINNKSRKERPAAAITAGPCGDL